MAGMTYRDIADSLGYNSPQAAHKAVTDAITASVREASQELIDLEVSRLDALLFAVWGAARKGTLGAIDRCIRIMERRSRLLGLDKPVKYDMSWRDEVSAQGGDADELFEKLVTETMARNGPIASSNPPTEA